MLVPLPECEAREAMLRKHLSSRVAPDVDFAQVCIIKSYYKHAIGGADDRKLQRSRYRIAESRSCYETCTSADDSSAVTTRI